MSRSATRGGWWRPTAAVVSRELREMAWRKRTYATRAMTAAFLGVVVVLTLRDVGQVSSQAGVFEGAIVAYMMGLALVVPVLMAGVIAGERENGTLALLLLTPLRAGGILVGKVVAQLALLVGLGLAAAPMLALTFLLGGVEPADLVKAVAASFGFLLWVMALTVWVSARRPSVGRALVGTYAWGIALGFMLPMVLGTMFMFQSATAFPIVLCWHPFLLWMALFDEASGLARESRGLIFAGNGAAILGFLCLAGRRLARETVDVETASGTARAPRAARTRREPRATAAGPFRGPLAQLARREAGWLLDRAPAVYLELRTVRGLGRLMRSRAGRRAAILGISLVAFLLVATGADYRDDSLVVLLAGAAAVVYLAGLVDAVRSVAVERESRRIELIWPTNIGPGSFLAVKTARLLLEYGTLLLAVLTAIWLLVSRHPEFRDWLTMVAVVGGSWIGLFGVALVLSACFRRERTALETMVGIALLYYVLMLFLAAEAAEGDTFPLLMAASGLGLLVVGTYVALVRLRATWTARA